MPFSQEYLKDYEAKIHKLPLEELYEVLDIIQKDSTNERINIVEKRIKELTGELPIKNHSEDNKEAYTPIKEIIPPEKKILAILAFVTICFICIVVIAKTKVDANSIGFIIDEAFLSSIADYVYYQTLYDIFFTPSICFGAATIFYAFGFISIKEGKKDVEGYSVATHLVPAILVSWALATAVPKTFDLPPTNSEKSTIQVETVTNKKETYSRSAANKYYLYFSSGSRLKVDKNQYEQTYIDQSLYTIYQRKNIIIALPVNRYVLKVQAQVIDEDEN